LPSKYPSNSINDMPYADKPVSLKTDSLEINHSNCFMVYPELV
jgi:hypothetical protein